MSGQPAPNSQNPPLMATSAGAHNGTGHHHHHHGKHNHHLHDKVHRAFNIDIQEGHGGHHRHDHHNGTAAVGGQPHRHAHNGTDAAAGHRHHHHNGTAAAAGASAANKGAAVHNAGAANHGSTNSGPCPGCSVPLNNEVGAFSSDHIAAGAFALNFLSFIFGAALLGFSLWRTRPKMLGGSPGLQFYGLRVSLALFVVSRFFNWVFYAVPNARPVDMGYLIFYLIPLIFLYASQTALVYTFARTALQPLVQAEGFQRSRTVSISMTAFFGLVLFILWVLQAVTTGFSINAVVDHQDFPELVRAMHPEQILELISHVLALVYGVTFISMAAFAMRKSRNALGETYRSVPRFVMGAAAFWTVRAIFGIVTQVVSSLANSENASQNFINFVNAEPVINAITDSHFLLASFGILLLCFRSHLASFYVDGALNAPIKDDPAFS